MRDELDAIDWAALEHAYGRADDVPQLLLDLRSDDPVTRERARYWLGGTIVHQGTLYSATAPAVPFVARLARDRSTPDRAWIVTYLPRLAVSDPDAWIATGFDVTSPRWGSYFDGDEGATFRAAYDAVDREIPTLIALLGDDDAGVRAAVPYAIAWFAPRARDVREACLAALALEQDATVRASLLQCAALQDRYLAERVCLPRLDDAISSSDERVALVAAHARIAHYDDGPSASSAIERIAAIVARGLDLRAWAGLPWRGGDLGVLAIDALGAAKGTRDRRVEGSLFAIVERPADELSDETATSLARRALRPLYWMVTDHAPPDGGWTASTIPPRLRRFATAIVTRPFLAEPALFDALPGDGLPGDLDVLRERLGIARPSGALDVEVIVGGVVTPARALAKVLTGGGGATTLLGGFGGMKVSMTPGPGAPASPEESRARDAAIDALAALGRRAIPVAFALAAEEGVPFAPLRALIDRAVPHEPAGALEEARVLAARHAEVGPPRRTTKQGTQIGFPALVVALTAARHAATMLAQEPPPELDAIARAAIPSDAFWPELVAYLDVVPAERRQRFLLAHAERAWKLGWRGYDFPHAPRDLLLARALGWLEPAQLATYVASIAPLDVLPHLRGPRAAPLLAALVPRIATSIDEQSRWRKDDLDAEIDRHAEALAALGHSVAPVLSRAIGDRSLPRRDVFERALVLLPSRSQVASALRDAAVSSLDERGLMPLGEARALLEGTSVYERGDDETIDGKSVLCSDRVWAALLSLESAEEFVRTAKRIELRFHVRGRENTALVERYGDGVLPWLESRLERGVMRNVPWCVVPSLLAIARPRALEIALRTEVVDPRVSERDGPAPRPAPFALARAWIAAQREGYATLAFLAASGNRRAEALLREEWSRIGPAVREAVETALGTTDALALARRLRLPDTRLPAPVEAVLAEVAPEPIARGPVFGIATLDEAAARFDLPLWDNANYTTGAMRVTGYASPEGDALVIESIVCWPGAGEWVARSTRAFGAGARGARLASDALVPASDLDPIEIDSGTRVDGASSMLVLSGERDESGASIESAPWASRMVPIPMPPEHHVVAVDGTDVHVTNRLPRRFADADLAELRRVTPHEGILLQLCEHHRPLLFASDAKLRETAGIPRGARRLFAFDDVRWPAAGERASTSLDLVAICEALRTRRAIRRLPGPPSGGAAPWIASAARLRSFAGGDAWPEGDDPVDRAPIERGPGVTPYASLLLERGWPHGVQLLHDAAHHAPGASRATAAHVIDAVGPVLRVHWPRGAATMLVRAAGAVEDRWSSNDLGIARALEDERAMHPAEARACVRRFVAHSERVAPHAAADVVLLAEALVGGAAVVDGMVQGLAALGAWEDDRPALAAAVRELGFVLRRMPRSGAERDVAWARARLASLGQGGGPNDVGRALDLVLHGASGAARSARSQADWVHAVDDVARARAAILDPRTPRSGPDAQLLALAGDALLDVWMADVDVVEDATFLATTLAMFGGARATAALRALAVARPETGPIVAQALAERG
ncbi:DUF7003 family protein [Sandaracinus amylolyticus]|uniref:Uncharacterized protein n=1 Tax=Sandaracinus amylolyticus TaxID=927083 RepID=A0A0F6YGL3_9BACT|nr:hypothetical protein [Sandaracinus amylolyticus]AKF02988.1 hypothetical protein DB32_000136 [Sandaracinus amylolyticus]